MAQFVQQREPSDESGQPQAQRLTVEEDHEYHEHVETGTDMHGEPEQPKGRL